MTAFVDLLWLPLGAGGHCVRLNGRVYEALVSRAEHRAPRDLYHSALVAGVPEGVYAIESAPAWGVQGDRGVVAEGPVGARLLGHSRFFRYEVRRWLGGEIPDAAEAVESPVRVSGDEEAARRVLDLVPLAPAPVWGRDELGLGEMWNSNSLVAWLLAASGLDADALRPPVGGRAPGWDAGLTHARRQRLASGPAGRPGQKAAGRMLGR